ncbi:hypothetical protein PINS_up014675 [Pythium insidiosum]|nr:hypothetical protein PINS_up014675 [Pythium insidiosum]
MLQQGVLLVVEMLMPLLPLKMLLLALHPGQVTMDPVTMTKLHPQLAVSMHPQRVSEMKRVTETQPTTQPTTSITIAEAKMPKQTLSVVLRLATPT